MDIFFDVRMLRTVREASEARATRSCAVSRYSSSSWSSSFTKGTTLEPSRMFSSRMLSNLTSLSEEMLSMAPLDLSLAVSEARSASWYLGMSISGGISVPSSICSKFCRLMSSRLSKMTSRIWLNFLKVFCCSMSSSMETMGITGMRFLSTFRVTFFGTKGSGEGGSGVGSFFRRLA